MERLSDLEIFLRNARNNETDGSGSVGSGEPGDEDYAAMLSSDSDDTPAQSPTTGTSLCRRCNEMVKYSQGPMPRPFQTTKLFGMAALQGSHCDICQILYNGVAELHRGEDMGDWKFMIDYTPGLRFVLRSRRFETPDDNWTRSLSGCNIEFYCPEDMQCPWGIFSRSRYSRLTAVGTPEWFAKVADCVLYCTTRHDCWDPEHTPLLPTRVIDIGSSEESMRLYESKGQRAQYICLSHCWGGDLPFRTTTETLSQRLASIAWRDLPHTYRLAVTLARYLDIRYVWIDSLCIVQGDKDDWVRESAKMCEIYENSFLTVAATSSPKCTYDILAVPPPRRATMEGISTVGGKPFRILASDTIDHPGGYRSDEDLARQWRQWPLLGRSWVLQERLLSPRVMHVCYPELIWECRKETSCECGTMDLKSDEVAAGEGFEGPYSKVVHYRALQQQQVGDPSNLVQTWHDIVQWYTKLNITYLSDKLPAMSGLAKQMAGRRTSPTTYLAGLWEDSLCLDLCWTVLRGNNDAYGKEKQMGPSWSWATHANPVQLPLGGQNDTANQNETKTVQAIYPAALAGSCVLATADPMGQVQSGTLTIKGRIFSGTLHFERKIWSNVPGSRPVSRHIKVDRQTIGETSWSRDPKGGSEHAVAYFERFAQVYVDDESAYFSASPSSPPPPDNGKVSVVPLARVRHVDESRLEVSETDYALLLRSIDGTGSRYVRVGILRDLRVSGAQRHWDDPSTLWEDKQGCLSELGVRRTILVE